MSRQKRRRQAVLFLIVLCALAVIVYKLDLTLDDLIAWTPENKILAFFTSMLFFAVKSLSVFFPVLVLYLLNAHLFGEKLALLVNLCGISVGCMIPYTIGFAKGEESLEEIKENKYLGAIQRLQTGSPFFTTYMLRMFSLPMDLVSLYLGTEKIPAGWYLLGSLAGMAPSMIGITLTGDDIFSPSSPEFWSSIRTMILIIIGSFALFYFILKYRYPDRYEMAKEMILEEIQKRKGRRKRTA